MLSAVDGDLFRKLWLERLSESQDGVVTRAQLSDGGWSRSDIERALRRNELCRVHPRVYVTHTGPLTWRQRAWAAVLFAQPAALCGASVEEPRRDVGGPIHVAVDQRRRVRAPAGVVVHRMTDLDARVFYGARPPRLRLEDNALAMAHDAPSKHEVIGILADVVGRRGVTPESILGSLERFPSLRRRRWVVGVLEDLATGSWSVLEHAYLTRVECAHGLPRAARQVRRRTPSGNEYRDVEYQPYGLVVELDGRLGHDSWRATMRSRMPLQHRP